VKIKNKKYISSENLLTEAVFPQRVHISTHNNVPHTYLKLFLVNFKNKNIAARTKGSNPQINLRI
jgi:hypothetical protein